jgi:hypothetical protein
MSHLAAFFLFFPQLNPNLSYITAEIDEFELKLVGVVFC